jgi:glycosyltransferase involved in cell wall biosynthesis
VDHLHVHVAAEAAEAAWAVSQVAPVSYSVTVHARELFCPRESLRSVLGDARAVVTISEHNRDLLEQLGLPPARLHVVRQGIPVPRGPGYLGRGGNGRLRILFVGRLVDKKGGDLLVRALVELGRGGVDAEVTMVGDGPNAGAWRALASELGLGDRVRWTGALPRDGVGDLLRSWADVLVLPCRVAGDGDRDGIPVALMEGMAHGLPVISTLVSGIPELIEDGRNGLLVSPDDHHLLARALSRIAADPSAASRLGRAGRLRIEREHDVTIQASRLLNAIGVR